MPFFVSPGTDCRGVLGAPVFKTAVRFMEINSFSRYSVSINGFKVVCHT
jgi:hypothetical protein